MVGAFGLTNVKAITGLLLLHHDVKTSIRFIYLSTVKYNISSSNREKKKVIFIYNMM